MLCRLSPPPSISPRRGTNGHPASSLGNWPRASRGRCPLCECASKTPASRKRRQCVCRSPLRQGSSARPCGTLAFHPHLRSFLHHHKPSTALAAHQGRSLEPPLPPTCRASFHMMKLKSPSRRVLNERHPTGLPPRHALSNRTLPHTKASNPKLPWGHLVLAFPLFRTQTPMALLAAA